MKEEYNFEIKEELLRQAQSNIGLSLFAVIVNILAVVIVFWSIASHLILSGWLLVISAIVLARYFLSKKFLVEKEFKILAISTAILLSVGFFYFFPQNRPFYQALLIIITAGLSAGAVMTLSFFKDLVKYYLIILLFPLVLVTFFQGTEIHIAISLMIFLFMFMLIEFSRKYHHSLVTVIDSKITIDHTQKELQHSQKNFSTIFEESTIGVFTYDKGLNIQDANKTFANILQAPLENVINLDMKLLPDQNIRKCLDSILVGEKGSYEGKYQTKISDKEIWISMECVPMYSTNENVNGGLGLVTDITQEILSNKKISHQAHFDHLTGLANRLNFNNKLENHISKLALKNSYSALLFIDIDHFKNINDSLGHNIGDSILKTFALRAKSSLRKDDIIARLGGDEFVILLSKINENENSIVNISKTIAQKLHSCMKEPFEIEKNALHLTISIGINIITPQDKNINDILKHADIAMYEAKKFGRNTTCFYKENMSQKIQSKLTLSEELRDAIKLNQLELYYQPIVDIKNSKITSCEALLRWNHPKKGLVFPDNFIPHAEDSDLILSIGDWVVKNACKEYKKLCKYVDSIAINISPKQFAQDNFVQNILQTTKINAVNPEMIHLELTESVAFDNLHSTIEKIKMLKSHGFHIAMDDFGTGYSSLSYLKNLPFNYIKIDRNFIKDMLVNDDDASLVKTILTISKQFNFKVVAEGVETDEHIKVLKELKCDYYQGYVTSKPVPINKFIELFDR